ncbi:MAG TPA: asparagine synthetase B, partial [Bacteroidia bacterium]|nr:asparagine synthetase B [Bacteroidia bacterium]
MCGIVAAIAFTEAGKNKLGLIDKATEKLAKRGPDAQGIYHHNHIAIGHRRLSIIDTSQQASQPMFDNSSRYVIAFNGEFFNYQQYRKQLISQGFTLNNLSDTEVLLQLYIQEGEKFLEKINGFFALIIYDTVTQTVFIARDRMGVKPLYLY